MAPHFMWIFFFLWFQMLCFGVFIGWTSVVGVLCDTVVQSLWFPCLDALGLPFLLFVLALVLYLGFTCWWVLLPEGLLEATTPTLSCMLLFRCWFTKQCYQTSKPTPAKRTPLPHKQSQPQFLRLLRLITVKKDWRYYRYVKGNMRFLRKDKMLIYGNRKENW